jgi:hypothetical protein
MKYIYIYIMDKSSSRNENLKNYETLYIKICSKQVQDYMTCLDNSYDKLNDCEYVRNIYLSCIYDNKDINKTNEFKIKLK